MLLSVNPTFIKIKIKEGKKYAEKLQSLKSSIDEPLIIILTLNTIAHTVGSIMVGVQAKIAYSTLQIDNSYMILGTSVSEELLVGIISTIMTVLILVLSEIIPKTIGANYWDKLAQPSTIIIIIHTSSFQIHWFALDFATFYKNWFGRKERVNF